MTIFEVNESVLIQLEGRLDSHNAALFQQKLAALSNQHTLWILDMSNVEFVDSAGLVALVAGLKAANRHRCRLAICNLRPPVRLIFEITQLDRVFEIFASVTEVAEMGLQTVEPLLASRSEAAAA